MELHVGLKFKNTVGTLLYIESIDENDVYINSHEYVSGPFKYLSEILINRLETKYYKLITTNKLYKIY